MGRFLSLAFGIFCLVASMTSIAADQNRNLAAAPAKGGRIALVIGNASYPGVAALKNPVNDANDIAAKLRKLDFDVTLKVNVGLKEMLRSLTAFGNKVRPGSEVLVFYAGHGMQVRGRNYLIPIDAEIGNETAVSSESVDVDQLLDKLANARLSVVILDACRNNPFERRFRGGGQGLAQINAPTGTLIAYATAPGKVASDGDGRNGLYTQELLSAMDVPGIKVEDVFKRVRANVVRKSAEAQIPWEASSLTGDFYFQNGSAMATAPSAAQRLDDDDALWSATERGNSAEDYAAYLQRFPAGRYATLALSRKQRLEELLEDVRLEPERWSEAETGNTEESYRGYLQKYPNGRHSETATVRLRKLEAENQALAEQKTLSTICMYRKRSFNNSRVSANVDIDGKRIGVLEKNGDAFCVRHPPGDHVISGYGMMPPYKSLTTKTEAGKVTYVEVDSAWMGWETSEISEADWQQQVGPLRWR